MKRPTTDGHHGSHVTTPRAAAMMQLLGSAASYRSVTFTRDEFQALQKLYGFTPEGPNEKPPPPERPKEANYASGYEFRRALEGYERALERHAQWKDPQSFMQAGADRNAIRHAETDGLRLIAWLASHVPPGEDPLKAVIQLACDGGWDVDPEDVAWADTTDEETDEPA